MNSVEQMIAAYAAQNRRGFATRTTAVNGGTLLRVSWMQRQLIGGITVDAPVVKWYSWTADGEFLGGATRRRDAIEAIG